MSLGANLSGTIACMEDPAERARCAACTRPGSSWHGTGPFLVLHAGDAGSAETAALIAAQCVHHGVEAMVTTIHDAPRAHMYAFTTVVFVLPRETDIEVRPVVALYVSILDLFRAKRADGLAELVQLPWYFRGVAIWVGPQGLLENPLLERALAQSDAEFYFEDGTPDVFDPFGPHSLITESKHVIYSTETEQRFFGKLTEMWGIRPETAPLALNIMREYRQMFDSTRYTSLNGQKYRLSVNLFVLALDGTLGTQLMAQVGEDRWATFLADVSRACRTVIRTIAEEISEFHPPPYRANVQSDDVRALYRMLRAAVNHLSKREGEGE